MTLKENGYATAWFGKNHNVPIWEATPAGPFTNWPIGLGYDYFYGFVGGDTSQWQPGNLYRNTTPIHPYNGKPGLEPDHRDGRRRDRVHQHPDGDQPEAARGSSTMRRAPRTRRIIRPRSGSTRSAR